MTYTVYIMAALLVQAPVEPVSAIVEAFRSHAIVALGNVEGGNEQSHRFQLALIRDPRFAAAVNDIVVEFGNARFQEVVDRFVRGEDVPYESLRRVWQDTTQVEFEWDLPIYEEFLRAVRAVNASLPRARQLRVVLADPPIDWDEVHNIEDLHKAMGDRDGYAVDVLRREVLEKGRRALLIFGGQHLIRKSAADERARGIVARLEKGQITSVFTILPETRRNLPEAAAWPIPSLARLPGQFDAVLYLGPVSAMTRSRLAPALCADRAYLEMRLGRLNLIPHPPGATFGPAEHLKDSCAHPEGFSEIPDREPAITEVVRRILREAAQGKVSPEGIAPESQARLISRLERDGPRFLGTAGELKSLVLVEDKGRERRYRSVFGSGLRMLWSVGLSTSGAIVSLEPRPE